MKKLSVLLSLLLLPSFVLAQVLTDGSTEFDPNINANNRFDEQNQMANPQTDQLNLGTDQQIRDVNGFVNTNSGARNNGEKSQSDSNITQILGLIMGAAFASQCGPTNPAACAMAAMSFADAAASGGNSSNSAKFQSNLLPGANSNGTDGEVSVDDQAKSKLAQLSDLGYTVNSDGSVNTPDGDTFSSGDFASVESLKEKGFSQEQAESALALLKQVQDDAEKQVAANGEQSYGLPDSDEGGGGVTIVDEGPEKLTGKGKKDLKKKGKGNRLPASELAGLKKVFNGTPIGIKLANIFLIVNQKYKAEDKDKAFLKKEY